MPRGDMSAYCDKQKRGAKYGKAWMAFSSHIVEDGNLITGQNPASAAAVGEAVVKRLKEV